MSLLICPQWFHSSNPRGLFLTNYKWCSDCKKQDTKHNLIVNDMMTSSDIIIENFFFILKSNSLFTFHGPASISLRIQTALVFMGAVPDFKY